MVLDRWTLNSERKDAEVRCGRQEDQRRAKRIMMAVVKDDMTLVGVRGGDARDGVG